MLESSVIYMYIYFFFCLMHTSYLCLSVCVCVSCIYFCPFLVSLEFGDEATITTTLIKNNVYINLAMACNTNLLPISVHIHSIFFRHRSLLLLKFNWLNRQCFHSFSPKGKTKLRKLFCHSIEAPKE